MIQTSTSPRVRIAVFTVMNISLRQRAYIKVFNTPFWRRVVLAGVGIVAFYKYAPEPTEDNPIAKYVKSTMAQPEYWKDTAFNHLLLSAKGSDETLLVADAKPPVVHRYRFPQCVPLLL